MKRVCVIVYDYVIAYTYYVRHLVTVIQVFLLENYKGCGICKVCVHQKERYLRFPLGKLMKN